VDQLFISEEDNDDVAPALPPRLYRQVRTSLDSATVPTRDADGVTGRVWSERENTMSPEKGCSETYTGLVSSTSREDDIYAIRLREASRRCLSSSSTTKNTTASVTSSSSTLAYSDKPVIYRNLSEDGGDNVFRESFTVMGRYAAVPFTPDNGPEIACTPDNRQEIARTPDNRREIARTPDNRQEIACTPDNRREIARTPDNRQEIACTSDNRQENTSRHACTNKNNRQESVHTRTHARPDTNNTPLAAAVASPLTCISEANAEGGELVVLKIASRAGDSRNERDVTRARRKDATLRDAGCTLSKPSSEFNEITLTNTP